MKEKIQGATFSALRNEILYLITIYESHGYWYPSFIPQLDNIGEITEWDQGDFRSQNGVINKLKNDGFSKIEVVDPETIEINQKQ